jgi:hypothetical protein
MIHTIVCLLPQAFPGLSAPLEGLQERDMEAAGAFKKD